MSLIPVILITLLPTSPRAGIDSFALHPPIYGRPVVSGAIPREFRGIVIAAAKANNLPIQVLAKLIASESSWREWMVSGPNADGSYDYGIAGFNSRYIAWFQQTLGPFNPFVAAEAIPRAAKWLARLRDEFGSMELAVTAYKAGPRRTAEGLAPRWVVELAKEVASEGGR